MYNKLITIKHLQPAISNIAHGTLDTQEVAEMKLSLAPKGM